MTIILMLKAPRPGFVKTRLALTLGNKKAAQIYRDLVNHQIAQIPDTFQTDIHFTPHLAETEMKQWLGSHLHYVPQTEGNLGERLTHAMLYSFKKSPSSPITFLGGDCPEIDSSTLQLANQKAKSHDIVIGPARDGGYYLITLNHPHPSIFEKIDWSTHKVLTQTLERIKEKKLSYFLLPEKEDIDDIHSYRRFTEKQH